MVLMAKRKVIRFLPEGFDIEAPLQDQLSNRTGTQRFLPGEKEALLIVHEVPEPAVPEREALVFWRRASGEWSGPGGSSGLREIGELLGRYQAVIDDYEAQIDETEEVSRVFGIIRHAGPIARSLRNLAAALDAAVQQSPDEGVLIGLRDWARETSRAGELLYHDAKLTLDFWQAESAEDHQRAAERLNVIVYRLNLMAGLFLPLLALASLFGMNVEIPDALQGWFWWIVLVGLGLGCVVLFLVGWEGLRRKKR
jgi:hypothetical protein